MVCSKNQVVQNHIAPLSFEMGKSSDLSDDIVVAMPKNSLVHVRLLQNLLQTLGIQNISHYKGFVDQMRKITFKFNSVNFLAPVSCTTNCIRWIKGASNKLKTENRPLLQKPLIKDGSYHEG